MKVRSVWRANSLFVVKLRNGKQALVQTFSSQPDIAVFNEFRSHGEWEDFVPSMRNVLFCCWAAKFFFQNDHIARLPGLKPAADIVFPDKMLAPEGNRRACFWKGTDHEREVIVPGESVLLRTNHVKNGRHEPEYKKVKLTDFQRFASLELAALRIYPEFNERLNLCSELEANFDPLKEIVFHRPLDSSCRVYIDIISGKVRLDTLGY